MINNEDIILLKNRYEIYKKKQIGRGQSGIIYECQDLLKENPDKKLCAKMTNMVEDDKSQREFQLMSKLKKVAKGNPNIVEVIDVLVHDQQVFLILERCECDLSDLIRNKRRQQKRFTPAEALEIIKQITNGYKVLLDHNIIHRDLKPQNILYVNNTYKIADFGLARIADRYGIHTKLGTPRYSAPQLFWDAQYTYSADIYSLGIIFYQLIFDAFPFPAKTHEELKHNLFRLKQQPIRVSRDLPEFKLDDSIPTLIEQMLLYHESDRINWETLFKHKLLTNQFETKSINSFQGLSIQESEIEKLQKEQNINQKTKDFQNQIIPNTQTIIVTEISKLVKGVDPNFLKNSQQQNLNQSTLHYQIRIFQHYQIEIFFAFIQQELQKYLNTQYQNSNNLLHLRKGLCDLASMFIDSSKNKQLLLIKQQQQQEFNKLLINQKNLEIKYKILNLFYSIQRWVLQNQVIYIQEVKKQIKAAQIEYQNCKIDLFSLFKIIVYIIYNSLSRQHQYI